MQILVAAWDVVTTKTIANFFRKSKISSESQKVAIAEDNDPFKELNKRLRIYVEFNWILLF